MEPQAPKRRGAMRHEMGPLHLLCVRMRAASSRPVPVPVLARFGGWCLCEAEPGAPHTCLNAPPLWWSRQSASVAPLPELRSSIYTSAQLPAPISPARLPACPSLPLHLSACNKH